MVSLSMMKRIINEVKKQRDNMTIAVTPRAARCNGVKGNTYGEGKWYGINDSW